MDAIGSYEELSDKVMLKLSNATGHHDREAMPINEETDKESNAVKTNDLIDNATYHQLVVRLQNKSFCII